MPKFARISCRGAQLHTRRLRSRMKKVMVLIALAVITVYAIPCYSLSERGAVRFLDGLEDLSVRGNSAGYCARLHPDLRVSINDRSADPPAIFDGNEQDFCDYVSSATKGMQLLGISMKVTRNDLAVTRSWLHPWTAHVSYKEDRVTTMSRVNVTLHTQSEDQLTLVQTFRGVRLLELATHARAV